MAYTTRTMPGGACARIPKTALERALMDKGFQLDSALSSLPNDGQETLQQALRTATGMQRNGSWVRCGALLGSHRRWFKEPMVHADA